MLWTVRHHWPEGAQFDFNCYNHWAQLLLCRLGGRQLVIILRRDGVTQGEPLFMVLYRITLIPLADEFCAAVPDLLARFYADDAAFDVPSERSTRLMKLLL